ncbi:uncharacterized protein PGTG_01334 [Puccinia graminis f. sp. tritici CRL 75-36-700-3]|uniref:CxC1-like cysteine cluster associated with KDZ transposases domain-containing protein n=1 Tax=Puccinia graminis f. sp. tritici (strain CRL 75-36-700-3 / race SCCL) TaxID=418459 RepID=E3JVC8_PUCGT|nr:uncharacterized protein PGTG_01334 [Puccinia graminis f. sp. tritici CRL 75-36-700-3]EFP76003.2 hypothetical protein PGTG_01334 [Puccinia graminis f. sp. tritici CRL 75-36-700-3]
MNEEDEASRARLRSLHQEMIQQQRHRNWNNIMAWLFPSYLHFKKLTSDWTLPAWNDNLSAEFFLDSLIHSLIVIDIQVFCFSGQRRVKFAFCACTPDPVHLLASGYLASTPVFPQTAFSVRLLNFYDILWNICNAHTTPFAKVLQRWNESRSIRLHAKNSTKARELRRNLVAAIDAYRTLKDMQQKLVQNMTSINRQEVLAQQSCPACFGVALQDPNPAEPPPADSADNHKVFICLDGNFQHRHHERASKNYIGIQNQSLFVRPEEIDVSNQEIREGELAKRVSKKAKDRCTEQHKAADDRRNASSWKGCDDTGLFGCCCRHDSVISFCNIHKSGEGRGLPMSIIKRFFNAINPNIENEICDKGLNATVSDVFSRNIQGELQPLRDTKSRGERLGTILKEKIFEALGRHKKTVAKVLKTFCDRRTDYLKKHAPDQLGLPENQPITYDEFTKLRLDDPFWNDTYLCLSKEPWAVNPLVRTGIHAVLRLDRAKEELIQLKNELRRCVSWGIHYRKQLKHRIDQCVFDTADRQLTTVLQDAFGAVSYEIKKIASNELELVQKEHEKLLLNWQPVIEEILAIGVVSCSYLPAEWYALVVFLKQEEVDTQLIGCDVDILLEETLLDGQDSDGESQKDDDLVAGTSGAEHIPPEDDDIPGKPSDSQRPNSGDRGSAP